MPTLKQQHSPDIPNNKYLKLPVKNFKQISEGFIYTSKEREIHGNYFHKGIDYETTYGEPVYASASGYAVSGYHRFTILNKDGTIRTYNNKPLANGFGYFVQIFHPQKVCSVDNGRITQYGHLSKIALDVELRNLKPVDVDIEAIIRRRNDRKTKYKLNDRELNNVLKAQRKLIEKYTWVNKFYGFNFGNSLENIETYLWTLEELKNLEQKKSPYVKWVKQGELLGYTGCSAVFYGTLPYRENQKEQNIKPFDSWDEIHLHFEEASRDPETRAKIQNRDPYGIYKSKRWYSEVVDLNSSIFK